EDPPGGFLHGSLGLLGRAFDAIFIHCRFLMSVGSWITTAVDVSFPMVVGANARTSPVLCFKLSNSAQSFSRRRFSLPDSQKTPYFPPPIGHPARSIWHGEEIPEQDQEASQGRLSRHDG